MKTEGRKIWICGDSTAASYGPEQAPLMGWGQALAEMLPEREIRNEAMAGRSTKTFLSEGRLDRLNGQVQALQTWRFSFALPGNGEPGRCC